MRCAPRERVAAALESSRVWSLETASAFRQLVNWAARRSGNGACSVRVISTGVKGDRICL